MGRADVFSDVFESLVKKGSQFAINYGQKQLVSSIYSIATQTIGTRAFDSYRGINYAAKEKEARNVMEKIIERFEKADEACSEFLAIYSKWEISRKATVEELNVIAASIHSDRFKGNISKMVGGCVGVIGGAAVVGAFVFPPLLPLAIGGGVASGLGGVTVFGSSIAEIVVLKKRLNQAKIIIEDDFEQFQPLRKFFDRSNELMEALNEVIGFDLMDEIHGELKSFYEEYRNRKTEVDSNFINKIKPMINFLVNLLISKTNLLFQFGPELASMAISFVLAMFIAPMHNMVLFDRIVLIQRLSVGVLSGLEAGLSLRTAVAGVTARRALQGVPTVAENMPKLFARSFKIFAGIGLALDVSNIILTSIDMKKGSFSEHGKKLKEAADRLQEEFEYVEKVHDTLRIRIF
ncbi:uncharacterized protein LOC129957515 [Argiope bruennichi]|uniref:uncharacterized protein LOC129957515 n=1 Tax=Argiope bruennichi TaxID=94029 RepID=UPI002495A143|nr:uncharacterized protein LOC129957515 [Argiope bruennichi]